MRQDFYLAWRHLRHYRIRSLVLIACLSLMGALPIAMHVLLDQGESKLLARARATPLVVGARASGLDLTLNALYFGNPDLPRTTMAEFDRVDESSWALALPIYSRFVVKGQPLVGITLDYLDYRQLTVDQGDTLTTLGDAVLGANAATALGLKVGDRLLTTPGNLFDLAGIYPLKLRITGILGRRDSPDDQAIFIDLKTAWIIEGLGHGHEAPVSPGKNGARPTTASPVTFTEVTPDNVASFHFHGDPATYPISAVIAVPKDTRASTLLRGRYLDDTQPDQLVVPLEITRHLLDNIFRIRDLFDLVLALVGIATLLALSLVFWLSLRMRREEMRTLFLLGSSRLTLLRLILAESLLLGLASLALGFFWVRLAQQGLNESTLRIFMH
ncbi:MAG: hypothetical protein RL661_1125 [Pseudomonadota bacterium]|jgi:putative ABC transport system permease protein